MFGGNSQLGVLVLVLFWIGGQETRNGALVPGSTVIVSIATFPGDPS